MSSLNEKYQDALWIAKSLFDRGRVSGSAANLSFLHEGNLYITGSGTCFGTLSEKEFSVVTREGMHVGGIAPSKELPLHRIYYAKDSRIQAVIHTHSFYSVLWSCLPHESEADVMSAYTPYLRMRLGTVGLVPYAKPGSKELFDQFAARVCQNDGFLLANHGPVVGGTDLFAAFYSLEELEESARVAWELRGADARRIDA